MGFSGGKWKQEIKSAEVVLAKPCVHWVFNNAIIIA